MSSRPVEIRERVDIEDGALRLMAEEVPQYGTPVRAEKAPVGYVTIMDGLEGRSLTIDITDAESCVKLCVFFGALEARITEATKTQERKRSTMPKGKGYGGGGKMKGAKGGKAGAHKGGKMKGAHKGAKKGGKR